MEAKNIEFGYRSTPLLHDLSTTIQRGKITTIIGPNGSGKSTLLGLLANQLEPKYGSIQMDGRELQQISAKEMAKKLATVYQQNHAPNDLTVERLISYGRSPYQGFFRNLDEDGEEIIEWAMEITNLKKMAKKRICELSGGERQRAWIAMALAQKTDILFLDEPTTYLDIYYQLEILRLVKRLNQEYGMTIVMVLHDINQAIQFSDELIIMKSGQILYQGAAETAITENRLEEVYGIRASVRWCEENQATYIVPLVI